MRAMIVQVFGEAQGYRAAKRDRHLCSLADYSVHPILLPLYLAHLVSAP